ncbi:MAG: hypothetical protein ACYCW5_02895 [Thermoleophilia bacterium]
MNPHSAAIPACMAAGKAPARSIENTRLSPAFDTEAQPASTQLGAADISWLPATSFRPSSISTVPGAGRERPPASPDVAVRVPESEVELPHPDAGNATANTEIAAPRATMVFLAAILWKKGLCGFKLLPAFSIFPI